MHFNMNYGFYSVKNDTIGNNSNFTILSKNNINTSESGCSISVIDYAAQKGHGVIWRLTRLAIAVFGSLATLGLSNTFSSFRLYWKEALSGREHHRIFSLSTTKVPSSTPTSTTKVPSSTPKPSVNEKYEFTHGVKNGSEFDLIIHLQSENPSLEKVKEFCEKDENILTKADVFGYTPLHLALEKKKFAIVSYLFEQKLTIHTKDMLNERTPWLYACCFDTPSYILDLFINNLSEKQLLETSSGGNALHLAVRKKRTSVIKHLLQSDIGTELVKQSFSPEEGIPPKTPLELAQSKLQYDTSFEEIEKMLREGIKTAQ